ncbi:hypothetical protein [Agromyces bauzanensis]|uniref:hypothetical protein n=1 Tax=Agromyces bauzanensis TaxID=1308924 RepID=UPI0016659354|nr:hypothetical protein [Agromyces bauzanensis]
MPRVVGRAGGAQMQRRVLAHHEASRCLERRRTDDDDVLEPGRPRRVDRGREQPVTADHEVGLRRAPSRPARPPARMIASMPVIA